MTTLVDVDDIDAGRRSVRWLRGHLRQLARYAGVSAISTIVGMTVLGALVTSHALTPGWANVVATAVGTVPSFELNRRWVWGRTGRRSLTAELVPFAALSSLGLGLSPVVVSIVGHLTVGTAPAIRTLTLELANVGSFGALWVLQFVVLDRVLFAADRRSALQAEIDPCAHAA